MTFLVGLALALASSCELIVNLDELTDGKCADGQKLCYGRCVSNTNPLTGCAHSTCAPCVLPNAIATCGPITRDCAVSACVGHFDHCTSMSCDTDLAHNPNHCGACGHVCLTPTNATQAGCTDGQCAVGGCLPGWEDCNHTFMDGCETNLKTESQNCGACNNVCPVGQACQNGSCG